MLFCAFCKPDRLHISKVGDPQKSSDRIHSHKGLLIFYGGHFNPKQSNYINSLFSYSGRSSAVEIIYSTKIIILFVRDARYGIGIAFDDRRGVCTYRYVLFLCGKK